MSNGLNTMVDLMGCAWCYSQVSAPNQIGFYVRCSNCGKMNTVSLDKEDNDDDLSEDIWCLHQANDDNKSVISGLLASLKELVDAMHRYEMDVEEDAPYIHREMMKRAHTSIDAAEVLLRGINSNVS